MDKLRERFTENASEFDLLMVEMLEENKYLRSKLELQANKIDELIKLFDEGFNSGTDHDLDVWEIRAKHLLKGV